MAMLPQPPPRPHGPGRDHPRSWSRSSRHANPSLTPLDAVLAEFTSAWDRGDAPRAEDFADRVPPGDVVELIYHEFCLAEAGGLAPSFEDFLARFPDQAGVLSGLFRLH